MAKTLIVHGWSDCSDSFVKLKQHLIGAGIGNVDTVLYADYESREDNLTFDDVIDGLNSELVRQGVIDSNGKSIEKINVIVHSTGGLVIRHWIWRYYLSGKGRIEDCPVERIVMLAPANFGSPLAHRGKSFLGQLVKGRWSVGDFLEVGRKLLHGLELASPFQWMLAHNDLLRADSPYGATKIQVTVLVGADDYNGFRGLVNKAGTDGTIVIAGAPLNTAKLFLDCCKKTVAGSNTWIPYEWSANADVARDFAFGVLPGLDHGSIVKDGADGRPGHVGDLIVQALKLDRTAVAFDPWKAKADLLTRSTYATGSYKQYQQFITRAVDDQGNGVPDYTLEFFVYRRMLPSEGKPSAAQVALEEELSEKAREILMREGHQHSGDPSYRRFLVDPEEIVKLLKEAETKLKGPVRLSMIVHVPRVDGRIWYDVENLRNVILLESETEPTEETKLFSPNTTTLLEMRINRENRYVVVDKLDRKQRGQKPDQAASG